METILSKVDKTALLRAGNSHDIRMAENGVMLMGPHEVGYEIAGDYLVIRGIRNDIRIVINGEEKSVVASQLLKKMRVDWVTSVLSTLVSLVLWIGFFVIEELHEKVGMILISTGMTLASVILWICSIRKFYRLKSFTEEEQTPLL